MPLYPYTALTCPDAQLLHDRVAAFSADWERVRAALRARIDDAGWPRAYRDQLADVVMDGDNFMSDLEASTRDI
jgi:hypothetical protein